MYRTDAKAGLELKLTDSGRPIGRILIVEKQHGGLQIGIDVPQTVKITRTQERTDGEKR